MKYLSGDSGRGERFHPDDPGVSSRHSLFASGAGITVVIISFSAYSIAHRGTSLDTS
jgi:hypothetical protein